MPNSSSSHLKQTSINLHQTTLDSKAFLNINKSKETTLTNTHSTNIDFEPSRPTWGRSSLRQSTHIQVTSCVTYIVGGVASRS
jgi:hypothetical protein